MNNGVLLTSGGLDSTVMAYWLINKGVGFVPLFIDYGQHCGPTELAALNEVLPPSLSRLIETVNIRDIYRSCPSRLIVEANLWEEEVKAEDLYIPYRNLLLLSVGAAVAQSLGKAVVYSAFINSNHAQEIDCSRSFFDALSNLLGEYGAVRVSMPFRHMAKVDVARLGLSLGVPLGQTFSCQANSAVHCGVCPNCVDRLDAIRGLSAEPLPDSVQPEEIF